MPDLHEPVGKDVKQEPPDELIGLKRHDFGFVVLGVVAPPEGNFVFIDLHEPVIADRDTVSVPAEIFKNTLGSVERRLAVNDPFLLVQIGDQSLECPRRRKMAYGAGVNEFIFGTELFQISDKFSPKELRHHFDREEEVILA